MGPHALSDIFKSPCGHDEKVATPSGYHKSPRRVSAALNVHQALTFTPPSFRIPPQIPATRFMTATMRSPVARVNNAFSAAFGFASRRKKLCPTPLNARRYLAVSEDAWCGLQTRKGESY